MSPLEPIANQVEWAGKNIAHNLEHLPEDRLDWKPAPTANSALEILNHAAYVALAMTPIPSGGEWTEPQWQPATNLREARELILRATRDYAAAVRATPREALVGTVKMPAGEFPRMRALNIPAVDLIHHHGQIAYIQTLLGDTTSHFHEG